MGLFKPDEPLPQQPTPAEQAQAQIMIDDNSAKRAAETSAAERAAKAAEDEQKRNSRNTGVNNALAGGREFARGKMSSLGIDDSYGLMSAFESALNSAAGRVGEFDSNPGSAFDYNSMWGSAVNDATAAQRQRLDQEFRKTTPVGWEQSYFADTADDSILDAILGDQYGAAFDRIDAARARGQLSDGAFQNTLRGLDTKKIAARSTLEDLGLGVLEGYRKDLGGIRDQYSDRIGSYKLGDTLNVGNDLRSAFDTRASSLRGRMQGDIYRALGDTELFSPDVLMARGGSAAPTSNNPLRSAFRDPSITDPTRTTGTTGVF